VVILASQHPYNDKRVFLRQARGLAEAGYDVHLIARAERDGLYDGVHVHALPDVNGLLGRVGRLRHLFDKGLDLKGDVFHCHEVDSCFVAIKLKRHLPNSKLIFDVHEDYVGRAWDRVMPGAGMNPILRRLTGIPYRWIVSKVDRVVTVSDVLANEMKRYYAKVTVVMNGMIRCGKGVDRQLGEPLLLGHVGELDESRGLPTVIKALQLIQRKSLPVKLIVFGAKESRKAINAYAENLSVSGSISVRDPLPFNEFLAELEKVHAGVVAIAPTCANNAFSLPVKLFDCLAAGLPVIGSDIGGIGRVLEQTGAGRTFPSGNAEILAERISEWAENECDRKRCAIAAVAAAKGFYSWKAQNQILLELYQAL
jgi:hypothetical protein